MESLNVFIFNAAAWIFVITIVVAVALAIFKTISGTN